MGESMFSITDRNMDLLLTGVLLAASFFLFSDLSVSIQEMSWTLIYKIPIFILCIWGAFYSFRKASMVYDLEKELIGMELELKRQQALNEKIKGYNYYLEFLKLDHELQKTGFKPEYLETVYKYFEGEENALTEWLKDRLEPKKDKTNR